MKALHGKIRITAVILLVQTIVWVIFTAVSMSQVKPSWGAREYVNWVSSPDIFFTGNYINAVLLTVAAVILFSFLFIFLKNKYESSAVIGFVFIPVYGLINLMCYSIQISVVPSIAHTALANNETVGFVSQLVQADRSSLTGYMNGLAYAVLGIPSIIFGLLMIMESKRFSGALLSLSGLFSMAGIAGYLTGNGFLSTGVMAGGVMFLFSLVMMICEFKYKE